MKSGLRNISLILAIALACLQVVTMAKEKGYSHVRVVRLSFVDGTVLVKRPSSADWVKASVNTPIEEGFSISTEKNSFAEVEFENGSTARMGQLSQIDFSQLAMAPDGAKINQLTFDRGYATFKLSSAKHEHDVYSVKVGQATLKPEGKAEFRADFINGQLRVEVFGGSVEATSPDHETKLTKNKVLALNSQEGFDITSGIQKDDWDDWVHGRDVQAQLAYNDSSVEWNRPIYGWSDLDAYGEWGYFPGFGYAWAPFVPAGWTPFSIGQWGDYPGLGYTWISAEPWGWLPFHYGYWNYSPLYGYMWFPGSMNTFSPGLVTWFQGPGYYGWAPRGRNGMPVCNPSAAGCVTAVSTGTLQNGAQVNAVTRVAVNPAVLTRVSNPLISPGVTAGQASFVANAQTQARFMTNSPSRVSTANLRPAPRILLMGQNPAQTARMGAQVNARQSFMMRARQPIMVHMGNTIGGRYNAAFVNRGGMNANLSGQTPIFLQHRAMSGFSGPTYQVRGGMVRMQSNGEMRSMGNSGGYRGPAGPAPMARFPNSRMSAPMNTAHSASAPSGPHR